MRRTLITAALLVSIALPMCAQRRGFSSPRVGASVGVRPSGRVAVRGGIGFGHNPRFGVFVNPRPFHHHPRRSFFVYPYAAYPLYAYPYYPPLGYYDTFSYSYASQPEPTYMAEHDTGLQNEVYRLQGEVDQLRQQQATQVERQQYALNSPTDTPRPLAATRPRQEPPAPPTVLVYRDGRRVEVQNYAVSGATLWVFSEERARKVPLADLDLDATRQVNEERGVEFNVRAPAR